MKTNVYSILFVIAIAVFAACDNDDDSRDTTRPTIRLNAPVEGAALKIGSDIHFDADFEDDVMLGSYKVEIHHNFNDHGHNSKADASDTNAFSYNGSWSLSGNRNKNVHHHEIEIPENVTPGNYHFMVYCSDAAGNESYVVVNVVLSHDAEEVEH